MWDPGDRKKNVLGLVRERGHTCDVLTCVKALLRNPTASADKRQTNVAHA
jgi:hypothetical protein